ncbi:hypothetical protein F0562_000814 [Nyssa sinensis]|uniref:Uncharacterized protein n=1 Tax=Nyssa sinensis TaxID=561372 RepID=A0A5J5C4W1_9ASTE|nr:hypothetical protein F0562_000814 [Nyssa sinensis]
MFTLFRLSPMLFPASNAPFGTRFRDLHLYNLKGGDRNVIILPEKNKNKKERQESGINVPEELEEQGPATVIASSSVANLPSTTLPEAAALVEAVH